MIAAPRRCTASMVAEQDRSEQGDPNESAEETGGELHPPPEESTEQLPLALPFPELARDMPLLPARMINEYSYSQESRVLPQSGKK
jgi:hypothetical protein